MTRAFLAFALPDHICNVLAVQQFLLPLPRRVPPEDFHLTLCFLGDAVPRHCLQALDETLQTLRLPAVNIALHGIGHFGGARPRSVFAAVRADPALDHMAAKLATAARRAGCTIPHTRFVPHVTLGRFSRMPPEDMPRLERAIVAGAAFQPDPFRADEMTLFATGPGDPPRYHVLTTYPLG